MTDADEAIYRYVGPGFRAGVPRRDLTARDAARLGPAVIRDVTGGDPPMYEPVKAGRGKRATKGETDEAESATPAEAEKE